MKRRRLEEETYMTNLSWIVFRFDIRVSLGQWRAFCVKLGLASKGQHEFFYMY